LVEVAEHVHAYLQRGSWGFSNAGLIAGAEGSLLVDTLYDLSLTRRMLDDMRRAVPSAARIQTLVNTHANGDHCWGNQLVEGADIVSSRAAAAEMLELKPSLMQLLVRTSAGVARLPEPARKLLGLLGRLGVPRLAALTEGAAFVHECFGAFEFGGIRLTLPTRTFDDRLTLTVADTPVELIQVGPAHTKGDVLVWLPKQRVVFTGDILFIESHPIVWEGPIANWIAACDRVLELEPSVVVPGHGPLTDAAGVRETRAYWQRITEAALKGRASGASPDEVARELLASEAPHWTEAHRLVVNLDTAYRELNADHSVRDPLVMFARMARLERYASGSLRRPG
jgi:glyoxylase-like metal-dependent hydrolase (beta-lactamase superfamily II)